MAVGLKYENPVPMTTSTCCWWLDPRPSLYLTGYTWAWEWSQHGFPGDGSNVCRKVICEPNATYRGWPFVSVARPPWISSHGISKGTLNKENCIVKAALVFLVTFSQSS